MNFLVYTEDPAQLAKNAETIPELTRENACRAVLIAMDRNSPEVKVEAWITAHCHVAHGQKSICSEQLAFLLHGESLGRLRNTVFAHLNSDLPLVFWWQGEFSDLFEERLYRLLNRLIFDSSSWLDPGAGFAKLMKARADTGGRMTTQDLSWTRSFHYRLAVARLFDDPMAQKALLEISRVRLQAQPEQRMAAYLLLAWLMTRAGWSLVEAAKDVWVLKSRKNTEITVEWSWDAGGAPIAELSLEAPDCEVKIRREAGNAHLCQSICAGGHCVDLSGPADSDEPQGLVASQLSRGGKNSLFLSVLPKFLELLEAAE